MAKYRLGYVFILLMAFYQNLSAQRINFSVFAGEDITITSREGPPGLNFNSKKSVILTGSGDIISIKRGNAADDAYVVVYEIVAAEGFDLLVDVNAPSALRIPGDTVAMNQIPLTLTIAYENKGANNANAAKINAIDAPLGATSLIIPVLPRSSGAPPPPPDPFSGTTSSRPTGKVYLMISGQIGPVGNVRTGTYEGEIQINVNYAGANYE
ncbi:hypothetical protein [Algoriphagus marincola]|uniref:hypothetical protein n=1 Tax=Algoriphagus marincola TaxID=264027 RepID=UPI0012DD620B|nr:hypothetical protein [Algoriphagus marincola]